jgi:hypothetical protein
MGVDCVRAWFEHDASEDMVGRLLPEKPQWDNVSTGRLGRIWSSVSVSTDKCDCARERGEEAGRVGGGDAEGARKHDTDG